MATQLQPPTIDQAAPEGPNYAAYRAMSSAAVAALAVSLLSGVAFLAPSLIVVPVVGVLISCYAIAAVHQRREELTGGLLAKTALVVSVLCLVGSLTMHGTIYLTEVPDGYRRISYRELDYVRSDKETQRLIPAAADALDGEKVFIKGYIYPGSQKRGIRSFLLVRDKGDCCFGGNPKITDRIQVTLQDPLRLEFDTRMHKLAGVLRIDPNQTAVDAGGAVLYHLEADYLK
ncbi:MAG: DUF3299 domain-containing protein [Pirellulales bacterium]